MKKLLLSFTILCFLGTTAFAQKKISNEVKVQYEITEVKSADAMAGMMKGSTMDMTVTKEKNRVDMNMMSGMVKMTILSDTKKDEGVMYMSMMGNKMKIPMTSEDMENARKEQEAKPKQTFEYNKKDTKKIAGYKCYLATSTTEDGSKISYYITDKIKVTAANSMAGVSTDGLEGFPLEFTIDNAGTTMTFSAQEVLDKVSKKDFEFDDSGYEEMTMEELEEMGMGGGLGF